MLIVNEVSRLTGVSIRTLHYYDQIGLLKPADITEAGYRLYDDAALERLQQILLFRELEFPLKEIIRIIGRGDFDRQKALEQQIELLTLKKERLEKLIVFAREIKQKEARNMDFAAFDKSRIENYSRRAKEQWGGTQAYKEFEEKSKNQTGEDREAANRGLMELFAGFGAIKNEPPEGQKAQAQVKKLQSYISENFYNCTDEILAGLGQMYGAKGEFYENIDKAGGEGCAEFASKAIEIYCR